MDRKPSRSPHRRTERGQTRSSYSRRGLLRHVSHLIWIGTLPCASLASVPEAPPPATLTTLHSFDSTDGASPAAALIESSDGNFYGTTAGFFGLAVGSAFKITSAGVLTNLHTFDDFVTPGGGMTPGASLIQGNDGNFYGTTSDIPHYGFGTLFKMTDAGALTTLYSFNGTATDGNTPLAPLIEDSAGNLYGTTCGCGGRFSYYSVAFKFDTDQTVSVLHTFSDNADGDPTTAALLLGTDGNFYGTTNGGADGVGIGAGTAFKLAPDGTYTTLYTFTGGIDGGGPAAALIEASDGNFYGTTRLGGAADYGTVFQLTPTGTLTTLYSFIGGADGAYPAAPLIQASDGNLYGTAAGYQGLDPTTSNFGAVFKITPKGDFTTIHSFSSGDGAYPAGGLIQASDGNFYGTTSSGGANSGGGANNFGTVFKLEVDLQPPRGKPHVYLTQIPRQPLAQPEATALGWTTKGATFCVASGEWKGKKSNAGFGIVKITTPGVHRYALTCIGKGGATTAVSNVTVW